MKLIRVVFHLVLTCLCFSGCTIIGNLDEISTLENYSHEKDNQHRLVKTIDDHYDMLVKAIDQGRISGYRDKAAFVKAFGEPILKKDLSDGAQRWLYRHAIFRLSKDKVFVYFDRDGRQVKWEKEPCSLSF